MKWIDRDLEYMNFIYHVLTNHRSTMEELYVENMVDLEVGKERLKACVAKVVALKLQATRHDKTLSE